MKYYIPTTTLNFNNILSSESVSPTSFFEKRGFGYSRWFEIPENENNNSILLYDRLSKVERMNSELEDHPMIIEITTDKTFTEIGEGIYASDKTIYLTPWTTKFIFLTEQDKRIALSLSDSSLETKMIRLYQRGFEVRDADGTYPISHNVSDDLNNSEIIHDRVINRLKGLLYGYYIGALLSSDESTVEYYNVLKELQNMFAAILSSPHREPTAEQERKVKTLIDSLLFHTPVFKEVESIVGDRAKTIEIVNVFSKYGKSIYNSNPDSFLNELRYGELDDNKALKWVSNELNNLNPITTKNLLSPDKGEIVVLENTLNSIKENIIPDKTENDLFVGLINYILTDDSINGKISSQRAELTDTLTMQARDLLGNQWETSFIRTFMNQLRKHVRGEEFNQEWNNGVLSSLAVVILKGDDWEVLLDFMKRKGMTDYRLAFAFYGVFNGFANLTRDFTDLLLNNDRTYVADVYREFHGSLHRERINISSKIIDDKEDLSNNNNNKGDSTNDIQEKSLKQRIMDFFYTKIIKGKRSTKRNQQLEEGLRFTLEKLEDNLDPYVFVSVLNDSPKWGSHTTAWKAIQEEFCPDYKLQKVLRKKNKKLDLDHTVGKSEKGISYIPPISETSKKENNRSHIIPSDPELLQGDVLLEEVLKFVDDPEARKQISKDINWFVDNYGNPSSKYYKNAIKSNRNIIINLGKYLHNNSKRYSSMIYELFVPIEKIIMYLKEKYDKG